MFDLFGDTVTQPECAGLKTKTYNAAQGFAEFWEAWPAHMRKVAKKQCLNKWAIEECALDAALIVKHVEWMKGQEAWLKDAGKFIPAPMVYLNQRRWDGWKPEPERPKKPTALDEIKAHKAAPIPPEIRARMASLLNKQ